MTTRRTNKTSSEGAGDTSTNFEGAGAGGYKFKGAGSTQVQGNGQQHNITQHNELKQANTIIGRSRHASALPKCTSSKEHEVTHVKIVATYAIKSKQSMAGQRHHEITTRIEQTTTENNTTTQTAHRTSHGSVGQGVWRHAQLSTIATTSQIHKKNWSISSANKFVRLAQGVGGRIKGTDTIFFIHEHKIPKK
jgi:hypothetical protein